MLTEFMAALSALRDHKITKKMHLPYRDKSGPLVDSLALIRHLEDRYG
jgi:hypothetical protein